MSRPGLLILIVGPSGAGKDSLLAGARRALADDPDVVFTRRVITRPADPDGEDHEPVTAAEFAVRAGTGQFLLRWSAHGNSYGIPIEAQDDLAAGAQVIANVSRTVIAEAQRLYPPVRVVEVTASPEILAERLSGRGREDADAVRARLARDVRLPPGTDPVRVVNDGTLEEGIEAFVNALRD